MIRNIFIFDLFTHKPVRPYFTGGSNAGGGRKETNLLVNRLED